ncbi:ABC transporter ATP-binding protein [Melghirimyces algeriensis]|uniref:ABC-2 type transport system ATP-binding protein n=1 Tax=Melghirimyces algeriensis TaxID=910412 RepID=A0A521BEA5_9BACL|nr:ABC transporter ATP-binding protein [Melghirimyces algeriensis]SMO45426.1 ABC-2 type transport system ATP-binding protein [Melghirimyces algeriensis]
MSEPIIQTHQLTKQYGKRYSVKDLDLRVAKGDVYGFLGPNGAGKTTTIKMLLGLVQPTQGYVQIFGQDIQENRKQILRHVGALVESPTYYGHLSGYENLKLITQVLGLPKREIEEVLYIVGLSNDAGRLVRGYSLGMKQRLGIAAALLGNPKLLILDEPTNGLDPAGIREIRELIKRLAEEQGMTILISSHLLSEIEQTVTTVGIIFRGQLIFQKSLQALKQRAKGRLELEVSRPEEAKVHLQSFGWNPDLHGDRICFEVMSRKNVAQLIKTLVQGQFSVYGMNSIQPSLENIFIQLTERESC